MSILNILVFAVSFYILSRSSIFLVNSLINISKFLKLKEYVVAFVIMGIATSLPEFFVAISSSFEKVGQLSFGNIIGANILNITLVVGLVTLISKKSFILPQLFVKDAWLIFLIAMTPFVLLGDGAFSKFDALVLVLLYVWYLVRLFENYFQPKKIFNNSNLFTGKGILGEVGKVFFGIILLLFSSIIIVETSKNIAVSMGLDLTIFGVLIIAIGTTLPEIIFSLRSFRLDHQELAFGNALGSIAVNSALILPISIFVSPFSVPHTISYFITFISFFVIFWIFNLIVTKKTGILGRNEALILISLYIIFVAISLVFIK